MNESYGGNIPARIWARFMKAALAMTPKHDFSFPIDEVVKARLRRWRPEYYLNGTEPVSCGYRGYDQAAQGTPQPVDRSMATPPATLDTPAAVDTSGAGDTLAPDATQPPNTVGDGKNYVPLDSAQPASTPRPKRKQAAWKPLSVVR